MARGLTEHRDLGGLLVSNATPPSDLNGLFAFGGASATIGPDVGPTVGEEGSIGTNSKGQAIWESNTMVGVAGDLPFPFEIHGGGSYTWTWTP